MFKPFSYRDSIETRMITEDAIKSDYQSWITSANINAKIRLIKYLMEFRRTTGHSSPGLLACKNEICVVTSEAELLTVFNVSNHSEAIKSKFPIILEHYKDFGFPNFLTAVQYLVKSMEGQENKENKENIPLTPST